MLIESGEKQHYCYIKRLSALLHNKTKDCHKKAMLHYVRNWFHKSGLARKTQKILQWREQRANKDRDARKGEEHPVFPK